MLLAQIKTLIVVILLLVGSCLQPRAFAARTGNISSLWPNCSCCQTAAEDNQEHSISMALCSPGQGLIRDGFPVLHSVLKQRMMGAWVQTAIIVCPVPAVPRSVESTPVYGSCALLCKTRCCMWYIPYVDLCAGGSATFNQVPPMPGVSKDRCDHNRWLRE